MSTRLDAGIEIGADIDWVWQVLVDWVGQARWIPLTTLRVLSEHDQGLGVRIAALSGFWLGRLPIGLLDTFVVTGWSPPRQGEAELEILHRGPYFTGEGVFRLHQDDGVTRVSCTELITVPGGSPVNRLVGLTLPVMRWGFQLSLRRLRNVCEGQLP
ncbi:MAG: SRPBCC family protein [Friedmanniella sp.]